MNYDALTPDQLRTEIQFTAEQIQRLRVRLAGLKHRLAQHTGPEAYSGGLP